MDLHEARRPPHGIFARGEVVDRVASDDLLGFGEGAVEHRQLAAGETDATALHRGRESAALEQARIDLEQARNERAAVRSTPAARQARARRHLRLAATIVALSSLVLAGWGVVEVVTGGGQLLLWTGVIVAGAAVLLLHRMSRVGARAATRSMDASARRIAELQDVELEPQPREWAPRELPRPLTASAGSRAAAVLDAEAARAALRQAALEESMRERAEAQRPPSIDTARPAAASEFSRMGYVDDAEIEEHVRRLLERRASGQ